MIKKSALTLLLLFTFALNVCAMSKVYIIKTADRIEGIKTLFNEFKIPDLKGKKIVIKPNFNSDDDFPATTHPTTLKTVIELLKAQAPASITIIERSGMGDTQKVLKNRGVESLAKEESVKLIHLDKLEKSAWVKKGEKGSHWLRGYLVPQVLLEADYVVNIPCLKTHRFGGDFTLSLKNNVGCVAKWDGAYNYMWELHASRSQRLMIAEINQSIPCDLIIMDGIKAFTDMGPDKGKLIEPGVMLAATDRIAIDAAGVAVLRIYGTTKKVMQGKIFEQEQIKRAAELGIGVKSPAEIEIIPINTETKSLAEKIQKTLNSL